MPAQTFSDPPDSTSLPSSTASPIPSAVIVPISVVVVNWNRRELLAACLKSLENQTFRDFEVVVVDNGSTDGSVQLVQDLARTFPVPLNLIVNSNNRGFCAANNQGFAASRSEFVALLNNDAEAEPEWLAALEAGAPQRRCGRHGGIEDSGLGRSAAHRQGGPPDLSRRSESGTRNRSNRSGPVRPRWRRSCGRMDARPCIAVRC